MTHAPPSSEITRAFEAQSIDPGRFHHAEHVRVAFDLLERSDFIDAAASYAKGLRALTAKAGAPQKFNLTITYAFISLIAERRAAKPTGSFETFAQDNADLMSKTVLEKWYSHERLHSDTARKILLLPYPPRRTG